MINNYTKTRLFSLILFTVVTLLGASVQYAGADEVGRDGRFIAYANGVIKDTESNLEWIAGPDKDTRWKDAKSWVDGLTVDGGGWRIPTTEEFTSLYQEKAK